MNLFPFFREIAAGLDAKVHSYYQGPFEAFEERQIEGVAWDLSATFAVLPPPPCDVLEIGPGRGRVTFPLADAGYQVFGLESSPDAAEQLSIEASARGYGGRVQVVHGDVLGFPAERFYSAVLLANLSINLFDARMVEQLLGEVRSLGGAGGSFCFGVLNEESIQRFEQYDGQVDTSFHSQAYLDAEGANRLMLMQVSFDPNTRVLRQNWLVDLIGCKGYEARYHIASLTETLWTKRTIAPLLERCGFQIAAESGAEIEGGGADQETVTFLRCTIRS